MQNTLLGTLRVINEEVNISPPLPLRTPQIDLTTCPTPVRPHQLSGDCSCCLVAKLCLTLCEPHGL